MWKRIAAMLQHNLKGQRGVRLIVLLGLVGLALILLSGFLPDSKDSGNSDTTASQSDTDSAEAYCTQMQTKLETILEQVEGVGNCRVMVSADGTAQTIYAQDTEAEQADAKVKTQRKHVILSDSSGDQALVEQIAAPKITGVIVVCDGASGAVVRERVIKAVQALLGLSANQIEVLPEK